MNWEPIEEKLGTWAYLFKPFFDSGGFDKIYEVLKKEGKTTKIVPEGKDLFRAFLECPKDNLKCIIVGQDPYPMIKYGKVVADGLAFSCKYTKEEQPSLKLIYDGLEADLFEGLNLDLRDTDLTHLAKQGVLLLNSSLTVQENKPGSHKDLWKPFMDYFFTEVLYYFSGIPIIFMGKQAAGYSTFSFKHNFYIKTLEHPAAAAYGKREWKHDNMFSWVNDILKKNSMEISWYNLPF